jgi:hypothetical protein
MIRRHIKMLKTVFVAPLYLHPDKTVDGPKWDIIQPCVCSAYDYKISAWITTYEAPCPRGWLYFGNIEQDLALVTPPYCIYSKSMCI